MATPALLGLLIGTGNPPAHLDAAALAALQDPFAQVFLLASNPAVVRSQNLDALYNQMLAFGTGTPAKITSVKSYAIADGGQIPYTDKTSTLDRKLRFVITCASYLSKSKQADILVVGSVETSSDTAFLQVASWDPVNTRFNYYARSQTTGAWFWNGNSTYAFKPETRLKGPFDGHVGGSLVMKELRQPWNSWHSSQASLNESFLPPNAPILTNPIWLNKSNADDLEKLVVEPGIDRWTHSRMNALFVNGNVLDHDAVKHLVEHLVRAPAMNLGYSLIRSADATQQSITLPWSFFYSQRVFSAVLPNLVLPDSIQVPRQTYLKTLAQFNFRLEDSSINPPFIQPGDSFFAFQVVERSYEDDSAVLVLLTPKIAGNPGTLSQKFVASLFMVDFPNPVCSTTRASLLQYCPNEVHVTQPDPTNKFLLANDLELQFVANARAAAATDPVAAQFLANYDTPDTEWQTSFTKQLSDYLNAAKANIESGADSEAVFASYQQLGEFRRNQFRGRKIFEFSLTTPVTDIPADSRFKMQADGVAVPVL